MVGLYGRWELAGIVVELVERKGVSEKNKKPYAFWVCKIAGLGVSYEPSITDEQAKQIGVGLHMVFSGRFEQKDHGIKLVTEHVKPYVAPKGGAA